MFGPIALIYIIHVYIIKDDLCYEKYLIQTPALYLHYIIRINTTDHRLPIETGNWARTPTFLQLLY